jgi:glycosyltransferase involved in cell wall biosynthesis
MPSRVDFLLFSADGVGGIARTVINLANRLADDRDVELISLYRQRERPAFAIDERVRVTHLVDAAARRGRIQTYLDRRPSRLAPVEAAPDISRLTDRALRRKLRSLPPGLLVSTRPSLHAAAAEYAPKHTLTIGQEHLNLRHRQGTPETLKVVMDSARRLDCLVTLTESDRDDYRQALDGSDTVVEAIPNAVPWPIGDAAALDSKVVVSAGRLGARKAFPRLIRAFAPIARQHPDWQLHIYGDGPERAKLEQLIDRRGLGEQVVLQGHSDRFDEALGNASVFAFSSLSEGFGMVLLEAMSKGVPVVSFDVPHGPSDLISDGVNGRLLPDGDLDGFTAALTELVEDVEQRRRMGAAAQKTAATYEIDPVSTRWTTLFDQLEARRG